jgi:hypothetical protein
MLPHKTAFALPINPRQVDRALPLDEADDLTPRISAGSIAACARDRASDALLRLRLLLTCEFAEDLAQLLTKGFASTFRNKDNMIIAGPSRVA